MPSAELVCPGCKLMAPPDTSPLACHVCGGPLDATIDLPRLEYGIDALIDNKAPGVWRYRRVMALESNLPHISLGEGRTPIIELGLWGLQHGLSKCRAKLEFMAPTGSFKDRGAATVIASLKASGVTRVVEDSSGNAGAAMAAYAARAGLSAEIYVPDATPGAKVNQITAYGATVHRVAGAREQVATAAWEAAQSPSVAYASHSQHPAFIEGTKSFALELLDAGPQLMPHHIVFPVGNGGLILSTYKMLTELQRAGLTFRMPRLHIAQAETCAPLVEAFRTGSHQPVVIDPQPTIAGGIAVAAPVRGTSILAAARGTGGVATLVTDQEISDVQASLAREEGLFIEATSATAFAAAVRLRAEGAIAHGETLLVPATGSGLKDQLWHHS